MFPIIIPQDYWGGSTAKAVDLAPSDVCINMVKTFEGLRLRAYGDVTGTRTIGYGHTYGVRAGEVIDEAEATALLTHDLSIASLCLVNDVTHTLAQHQYDALTSFAFNVGAAPFARSDVVRAVNSGNFYDAAKRLPSWCKSKGEFVRGLFKRRQIEAEWLLGPPF